MADLHDDLDDLHELVSFEDPDEHRTWVFDVTFLTSPWTCVFGRGCPGVLTEAAPELEQGCCSYGAHFVDDDDHAATMVHIGRLTPEQWQFHDKGTRDGATKRTKDGAWVTRMHKGACILLNRPGHPGGAGCALHRAALEAGERPLDWKPDVCWQLPLRLEESTDDPLAFQAAQPAYEVLRDEIVELVGEGPYRLLVDLLERRRDLGGTPVPHPALRRPVTT